VSEREVQVILSERCEGYNEVEVVTLQKWLTTAFSDVPGRQMYAPYQS